MKGETYESVLEIFERLKPSIGDGTRDVQWITDHKVIGLARAHDGKIEVFLRGERLAPTSNLIKEVLEHQIWFRQDNQPELEANRILLPAIGHFDQVAAFIATELLRNGADSDLVSAFRTTEPIIELAIKRLRISDQALLGLAGELLLLDAMCNRADDSQVAQVVDSWRGWRESFRDFTWGSTGVEVKTTTRPSSSHHVQGVHQLEPAVAETGVAAETRLYLVSIGLEWTSQELAFSVPLLVDSILVRLQRLNRPDAVETFLVHVREYGSGAQVGYDHRSMSRDLRFSRPFIVRFVRGYDMSDTGIEVLHSSDLAGHHHVVAESVTFRVELPERVSGSLNPIDGLYQTVTTILTSTVVQG